MPWVTRCPVCERACARARARARMCVLGHYSTNIHSIRTHKHAHAHTFALVSISAQVPFGVATKALLPWTGVLSEDESDAFGCSATVVSLVDVGAGGGTAVPTAFSLAVETT